MSSVTQKSAAPVLGLLQGRKSLQTPRQEPVIPYFADDDDDGMYDADMMLSASAPAAEPTPVPSTEPTTATQIDEFADIVPPARRRETKAERRARKQAARRNDEHLAAAGFVTEHSSEGDEGETVPYVVPVRAVQETTPSVDVDPEPVTPDAAPASDAPVAPSESTASPAPAAVAEISAFPEAKRASKWESGVSLVLRVVAAVTRLLKRVDWVALAIFATIPLLVIASHVYGALPVTAIGTCVLLTLAVVRLFAGDIFTSLFFANRSRFLRVLFQASVTLGMGLLLLLCHGALWEVLVSVTVFYLFAIRSNRNARS